MLERSQDSSVSEVTGVGARRPGIVAPFPAGQDIVIFPQTSGKRLGTTDYPVQWVPGLLTRRVNWPGGEADHSSLSSVEVKEMSCTSTLPMCLHGTHRDYVTFCLNLWRVLLYEIITNICTVSGATSFAELLLFLCLQLLRLSSALPS